ncbi:Outer membrane protein TolC [Persephonella hydrogeniphila]|uniref:Outer membrane protein TolC n=1 Tax=Persephonella hydrogeniphila TaxID=198703 RepID=A0A285NF24_9AQUI|nr:TolC family protein [Persephonella hydrogeniphila]SNZ08060.1 Outer membrane protein TolC [Persephonella hydrogeniphila]
MFFKKILLTWLLVASSVYAVSLQEIIQTAKENNPVLKQKSIEIKIQQATEKRKKAERFGEIDIFGAYNRYEGKRILYPISAPVNPRSIIGAENQFIGGISYSVPIFTGFQIEKSIEVANIGKKIKEIQYRLTKNEIIYNIKVIYMKILSLQKQREAFKTYKNSLQELYKNIKEMVEVGRKPEVDLLKVKYDLENVEATIQKIENSINSLKAALRSLSGIEDLDLSELEDISFSKSYPEANNFQLINNLDTFKQIYLKEEIDKRKVQIAKGEYFPKVFLKASVQRNMGNDEYKDLWQVSLNIKYNLFDFGKRRQSYIASRLELSKTKQQERTVKLSLISRIEEAVNRIKTAEAQIKAKEKQVSFAKEVEKIEKAKYEEGVSELYDYLYAKSQFYIAKSQYYQALYNREIAISYLRYLLEEYKDE